jgi:hypothetical protein
MAFVQCRADYATTAWVTNANAIKAGLVDGRDIIVVTAGHDRKEE